MNDKTKSYPTLAHRSAWKELPANFGELSDTITLSTERVRAISSLVQQQLEEQTLSNEVIGICVDVISQEVSDINAWLWWWLDKDRKK
jgi:biotin synthase-related radical SAM superfamily protein